MCGTPARTRPAPARPARGFTCAGPSRRLTWRFLLRPQTHALVRHLQLMLPGIRIWLDVDDLEDIGQVEEAVQAVAVVVIFLSAGYFASRNCRPSDAHPPIRCAQLRDQSRLRAMSEQ